jgi:predicted ArsR family transcriptional regulator
MLLSGLFGNETAEKVLLSISNYGSGYPRGIAMTFGIAVSQVQRQLERLEREAVLSSRLVGRTRVYELNPRYLFRDELEALLKKALKALPPSVIDQYFTQRRRPRRRGKPLVAAPFKCG